MLVVLDRRVVLLKGTASRRDTRSPNSAATRFEMNSMASVHRASILQLAAAGSFGSTIRSTVLVRSRRAAWRDDHTPCDSYLA